MSRESNREALIEALLLIRALKTAEEIEAEGDIYVGRTKVSVRRRLAVRADCLRDLYETTRLIIADMDTDMQTRH